jgi:alkylation response protein AidB-like acyl-CoA dehydrogenase
MPPATGYRFNGCKSFGSLTPVWTYLGIHGMDMSDPKAPKVVHVFMPRDTKGASIVETWDALGMRYKERRHCSKGCLCVADKFLARIVPAGPAGLDQFVWASSLAEMAMALEGIEPHLDRVAEEWSSGKDWGALWPSKIVAAKQRAVGEGWEVVDLEMDVAGGFGIFSKAGLERLFRDARLGRMLTR